MKPTQALKVTSGNTGGNLTTDCAEGLCCFGMDGLRTKMKDSPVELSRLSASQCVQLGYIGS